MERVKLLGYPPGIKAYKVISLETGKTMTRRDVTFNETDFNRKTTTTVKRSGTREQVRSLATWQPSLVEEEETSQPELVDDVPSEEEDLTQADSRDPTTPQRQ